MDGRLLPCCCRSARALERRVWLGAVRDASAVVSRLGRRLRPRAQCAARAAARWPGHKALIETLATSPGMIAATLGVPIFDMLERWSEVADPVLRDAIESTLRPRKLAGRFGPEVELRPAWPSKGRDLPHGTPTTLWVPRATGAMRAVRVAERSSGSRCLGWHTMARFAATNPAKRRRLCPARRMRKGDVPSGGYPSHAKHLFSLCFLFFRRLDRHAHRVGRVQRQFLLPGHGSVGSTSSGGRSPDSPVTGASSFVSAPPGGANGPGGGAHVGQRRAGLLLGQWGASDGGSLRARIERRCCRRPGRRPANRSGNGPLPPRRHAPLLPQLLPRLDGVRRHERRSTETTGPFGDLRFPHRDDRPKRHCDCRRRGLVRPDGQRGAIPRFDRARPRCDRSDEHQGPRGSPPRRGHSGHARRRQRALRRERGLRLGVRDGLGRRSLFGTERAERHRLVRQLREQSDHASRVEVVPRLRRRLQRHAKLDFARLPGYVDHGRRTRRISTARRQDGPRILGHQRSERGHRLERRESGRRRGGGMGRRQRPMESRLRGRQDRPCPRLRRLELRMRRHGRQ